MRVHHHAGSYAERRSHHHIGSLARRTGHCVERLFFFFSSRRRHTRCGRDWSSDVCSSDLVSRDIVSKRGLEALFGRLGISNDQRIVLYGDFNNWFAAFAFWVFKYYGVDNVVLLNGGRKKWIEQDLPVTKDVPAFPATTFTAKEPDETLRVYLAYVREAYKQAGKVLVDVRGPKEFSGEILAPPEYPTEHAQRGGHIPGAKNIPWAQAVNED